MNFFLQSFIKVIDREKCFIQHIFYLNFLVVLFKSFRNCKRRNKGKIKLCGGGGNIILFKIRFQSSNFLFRSLNLPLLNELTNIFHVKDFTRKMFSYLI